MESATVEIEYMNKRTHLLNELMSMSRGRGGRSIEAPNILYFIVDSKNLLELWRLHQGAYNSHRFIKMKSILLKCLLNPLQTYHQIIES
jgi:hypothetical protein